MNLDMDTPWRILVVEDEALLAEEIRGRLQDLGHEVVGVVDNGTDALDVARRLHPDLVLMDIRIKGHLDGIETADFIFTELGIPVVFSTAHSDRDTLQQARIAGMFGHIVKPWRELDLKMAIQLAMHRYLTESANLRQLDASIQRFMEAGSLPVVMCNPQGRILAANAAAEAMFGYPRELLTGQPFEILLDDRDHEAWHALRREALGRPSPPAVDEAPLFNARHKDGMEFPVKVAPTCVDTSAGPSLYLVMRGLDDVPALLDPVTRLPSREGFREIMRSALRNRRLPLALVVLDLDHFKEVNDMLGHEAGDHVLARAASRMRDVAGTTAILSRLGGDDFALLLTDLADPQVPMRTAQQLVDALGTPFDIDGKPLYLTASAGVAFCPDDATTAAGLLKAAELAMYVAKAEGRNRSLRFSPEMEQDNHRRRELRNDLRGILQRDELFLQYQPIIDLGTGRATKVEALLRWRHPRHGLLPPLDFIPLLEESCQIHEVGEWVFNQAACFAAHLEASLGRIVQVCVNMSAAQFGTAASGAVDWPRKLAAMDLPDGRVGIEITESMLIEDRRQVRSWLHDFRSHGLTVSIDDFGTGFSSLSYLKTFSIDYLKIDASFTRGVDSDPNDFALTEAIIMMARKLGFETIAEGVETTGQARTLQDMGCDFGQGYLFSRPLDRDELERYLRADIGD